jgi:hypothetical protein
MRSFDIGPYVIEHHLGAPDNDVLWITFDHAGLPKHQTEGRVGWGVQVLSPKGWEVVAVKARRADWFTQPQMAAFFRSKRFRRICEGKRRVIFYGLSMGGFAALSYCSLVPGSVAFAISPQTTLHPAKVPWEKRFDYALDEDWEGKFSDVAALTPAHAEAYVLYSPLNKFDGPHVDRIAGFRPLTLLPLSGNAHVPGGLLQESGLLKRLVAALAEGPLTREAFDILCKDLTCSAAYHYYAAQQAVSADTRDAAILRCLELATEARRDFYLQRCGGLRMRAAAREKNRIAVRGSLEMLRRCTGWAGSIKLKLMALRFVLRVEDHEAAALIIEEIAQDHPDGHPKLPELIARADRLAALAGALESLPGAVPEVAHG